MRSLKILNVNIYIYIPVALAPQKLPLKAEQRLPLWLAPKIQGHFNNAFQQIDPHCWDGDNATGFHKEKFSEAMEGNQE